MTQAEEINQSVDQWRTGMVDGPVNQKPGSLDAVIAAYKKSRHFKQRAESTQKDYIYYLRLLSEWAGNEPASIITPRMVQNLYETLREKKPRKAAYLIQVLRLTLSYAEDQGVIPKGSNPASRPKLEYRAGKGKLWSHDAVKIFVQTADDMGFFDIGTTIMLNEWMGQRRGDLLRISINAYRDGQIHIRQSKTGAEVSLPVDMVPALKSRIDAQIKRNKSKKFAGTTLIQQTNGRPYAKHGFVSAFERIKKKATEKDKAIEHLVFKDLRHTAVTRMAEAGATIQQVASVTGHTFKSCEAIIDRYNIRTTRMAGEAFRQRIESSNNEKQKGD